MTLKTFERVLANVPTGQRLLRLHHFGESFLHPELPSFIRSTRDAGLIPVISVNPASLHEALIDRAVESGIGVVCFSLDSLRTERLREIRGIRKTAEYCLDMIDAFIRKSRSGGYPVLKVIQMVALDQNMDEREAFLALKERYPEEDVYVYISGNYGFGDSSLIQETDGCEAPLPDPEAAYCNAPFDDIVYLWNGDVVLCCYDHDGFNVIGNINEEPLERIWQGERIRRIREIFERRETAGLPLCGKCFLAPHNFRHQKKLANRGFAEEESVLNMSPRLFTGSRR